MTACKNVTAYVYSAKFYYKSEALNNAWKKQFIHCKQKTACKKLYGTAICKNK